ncbi:unnamed protein product [Discosporangium mesarthrocarpum]
MTTALIFGCLAAMLTATSAFMAPSTVLRTTGTRGLAMENTRVPLTGSTEWSSRRRVYSASMLDMVAAAGEGPGGEIAADAELAEAKILVEGQSTGGYFRAHARNEAFFNRNLCGALKELDMGQTEIIVEGKTSAIRSFIRWCKRGPGLTQQIQAVSVDWAEYTGIFDGFEVFPDEKTKAPGVAGAP